MNHVDPVLVTLVVNGEHIATTPEHPFYIGSNGWTPAGALQVGDEIRRATGEAGIVQSVTVTKRPQVMYNLTVADAHTFFVGNGQWLVHNECLTPNQINKAIRQGKTPTGKVDMVRVDTGKILGEQTHIHLSDGSALNMDGTWKHLSKSGQPPTLNSRQAEWLQNSGWVVPK